MSAPDSRPFEPDWTLHPGVALRDWTLHPGVALRDWTLHPGVALREELGERGISEADLARLAQLGPETVSGLLNFTVAVNELIARQLEKALGGPSAQFWLNYQANYERDLARGAKDLSRERRGE